MIIVGVGILVARAPMMVAVGALVVMLFAFFLVLQHARRRVIVEAFVDFTERDATAVRGLATLLVSELEELRRHVDPSGAIPAAVGIERLGVSSRGTERHGGAADYLAAVSDDLTKVLEGPVASSATVQVGLLKLPVGLMLSALNRLVRGPRIVGSMHRTESGGFPVLTAQMVGGPATGMWRVEHGREPETACEDRAFLHSMVRELACQMFTDLSFRGSTRWKALDAFAAYLCLYRKSDNPGVLKKAERKLLDAVAEDERFGLAYYNLGVMYTKLAYAGSTAEPSWQEVTRPRQLDRNALAAARREAARVAFWKATETAPQLWQADYALAATQFRDMHPRIAVDEALDSGDRRDELLGQIVRGCDHALALGPPRASAAVIYDLRGIASVLRGKPNGHEHYFRAGMRDHRKAVRLSWLELCRAERLAHAHSGTAETRLEHEERVEQARDNVAAALHNLAVAHARRAMLATESPPGNAPKADYAAADRIFRAAIRLGSAERSVASHVGRGDALEHYGESMRASDRHEAANVFDRAAAAYRTAAHIKPTHAEYTAIRARALAKRAATLNMEIAVLRGEHAEHLDAADDVEPLQAEVDALEEKVGQLAGWALLELAPAFRHSVAPLTAPTSEDICRPTLDALTQAYRDLNDSDREGWIKRLTGFSLELQSAGRVQAAVHGDPSRGNGASLDDAAALCASIRTLCRHRRRWKLEVADRNGEFRDTERRITQCLVLDQIDMALVRLHAAADNWNEAATRLRTLIKSLELRDPPDPERIVDFGLRAELARALRHAGKREEALKEVAECLRANPLSLDGHREAGRIHYWLGQYGEALAAWERALALAPNDAYGHLKAAICHRQIAVCHQENADAARGGKNRNMALAEAAWHLDTALELFENEDTVGSAWARVWAGRVALERGHVGESIAKLTGAAYGPASTAAWLFLGEAHLGSGDLQRAKLAFDRFQAGVDEGAPATAKPSWSFILPLDVLKCRLECGLARYDAAVSGSSTTPSLTNVRKHIGNAELYVRNLSDVQVRHECQILIAEADSGIRSRPEPRRTEKRHQHRHRARRPM